MTDGLANMLCTEALRTTPSILNQLAALDLPGGLRMFRPVIQNMSDLAYAFDTDGILRNTHSGETLSMKVTFTGASLRRQELIRAMCIRDVRQRLFDLNMQLSSIPIPGCPTSCIRVLHSKNLFTHRGPVLLVLQGGAMSQAGVWATRLLLHPQHGLRSGSQIDLVRKAHELGYAVALIHGGDYGPTEAELDTIELISALSRPMPQPADCVPPEVKQVTTQLTGSELKSNTTHTECHHTGCPHVYVDLGNANLLTGRSVVRTQSLHLDCFCIGLGNPAVSQLSYFSRVAWYQGTGWVLQLNGYHYSYIIITKVPTSSVSAAPCPIPISDYFPVPPLDSLGFAPATGLTHQSLDSLRSASSSALFSLLLSNFNTPEDNASKPTVVPVPPHVPPTLPGCNSSSERPSLLHKTFKIPGCPTSCIRVLHSKNLFTHRGPVLLVLQGGAMSQAGVWATRLLLHPQHGLRSGSQIDLVRKAHELGYAVALIHGGDYGPTEAELDTIELISALSRPMPQPADCVPPEVKQVTTQLTGSELKSNTTHTESVVRTQSLHLDCFCIGLGNPAVSQLSYFSRVAWYQGTGWVLQLNGYHYSYIVITKVPTSSVSAAPCPIPISDYFPVPPLDSLGFAPATGLTHQSLDSLRSASSSALFSLLLSNFNTPEDNASKPTVVPVPPHVPPTLPGCNSSSERPSLLHKTFKVFLDFIILAYSCSVHAQMDGFNSMGAASSTLPSFPSCLKVDAQCPKTSTMFMRSNIHTHDPKQLEEFAQPNPLSEPNGPPPPDLLTSAGLFRKTPSSMEGAALSPGHAFQLPAAGSDNESVGDISVEDQLYGVWRQLVPRLLSNKIVIWAHQQGGVGLVHPLRPMPGVFDGFPAPQSLFSHQKPSATVDFPIPTADLPNAALYNAAQNTPGACYSSVKNTMRCPSVTRFGLPLSNPVNTNRANRPIAIANTMSPSLHALQQCSSTTDHPLSSQFAMASTSKAPLCASPLGKLKPTRKRHISAGHSLCAARTRFADRVACGQHTASRVSHIKNVCSQIGGMLQTETGRNGQHSVNIQIPCAD
ncbi:hypothetical protein T265_12059 [Opisthorchis viverrini]|uniref:Arb2 domain-containing protein n=1 Tax=Opisthorchis viverrini TaxID=6198 RepID=A0A074Z0K5_OPIVI|nr:hypothetical protein T265_12059 [Opisthorchis viverrini]KER19002.1 hypothetical protein T265_12059 [Opisthorchis viverrini]